MQAFKASARWTHSPCARVIRCVLFQIRKRKAASPSVRLLSQENQTACAAPLKLGCDSGMAPLCASGRHATH